MAEHQEENQVLTADPQRQAHDMLRGYVYQIWHSVHAWLSLAEDEILYLEGAEDFDQVLDDTATAVQVKDTQHNITLRSQEVNDAINRYWALQANHPDLSVKFRFLTRSKIGAERGNPFGEGQMGLQVWSHCSGDEAAITKISKFLQDEKKISEEVDDFLKKAAPREIYEQLIEPITWETDSKEASFVEKSISDKLTLHGARHGISPSDASKVVDHLLKEALMVATQPENRELTRVRFLEIFEEKTTQRVSIQHLQTLQMQATMTDPFRALSMGISSDITIQSQSPILTTIPPPYPDVIPRKDLLASIQTQLQSEGIAVIQGGAGRGKTTLAKLTAKSISGSWFWVNFANIDSSHSVQRLQELATEVSNQFSPVNIVLDDLNLQPQKLRQYEEVLGIIVYRVLERGGKLLITSQHKLPNNLIRRLGVPQSVSILVPDFTISEIEQFAQQLGCPPDHAKPWAKLIRLHTRGHPRLVHARLVRLREKGWKQNKNESVLQTPPEVIEEREEARQLLIDLPEDQREYLYRLSLMFTSFRKDYALNIGEIPESIPHPGDIFSQLVGPWIDPVNETYYTISPLLQNAADQVWSESKINDLHAEIANAILKAKDLTTIEAEAVLVHSVRGENKEGIIAVIWPLITMPDNKWKLFSPDFSWLIHVTNNSFHELSKGDVFVNHLFRSLQYRIAIGEKPECAPKILEIWDKETKPHYLHNSYHLSRIMLATQALLYYQVQLPVRQMVGYVKEIIDIINKDKDLKKIYGSFEGHLAEQKTDKAKFFSTLFSFILARRPIYAPALSDLIDALDELQPKIRALLLADFKNYNISSRILIDSVWMAEEDLENSDWTRCLQVYDKVIERTIAWGYPHIASAAARGKAIIYDEYLHNPDTAHQVLQDIVSKVGPSPLVEEECATVYLHHKHYQEALDIYERILPEWSPSPEKLDFGPSEGYRRAAICAAYLNDWEKAATFFQDGAKRAKSLDGSKKYIGLYADAGFAQFKAGNVRDSLNLLSVALQEFDMLPQDDTDVGYFTLKKLLGYSITWLAQQNKKNNIKSEEPPPGFCSDPARHDEIMNYPNFPIQYAWLYLAQMESQFNLGMTIFEQVLQITDRNAYPSLRFFFFLLKLQHDFRNKTFDELPQRMCQLADACVSMQKHEQSGKEIGEKGFYAVSTTDLSNFVSVKSIIGLLVAALLVQLSTNKDTAEILAKWRANSSGLPIKQNMIIALDLIESILEGEEKNALTVMRITARSEDQLVAALKVAQDIEMDPQNLFYAHILITTAFIDQDWEECVEPGLIELLSKQWLKKTKFRAVLRNPMITVPQIEQACNSSETGKKKIGQILLAAHQAVSLQAPSDILQQFRSWTE
ncbi:MAG: hypothetical protein OXH16_07840 [Gemmatimonadetes bacterium]|nr:hypothetical protein [Gemmatimonadota bacterium]